MKKYYSFLLILCCFLFSACSTDLMVIGNYKETMIVYGLLNQSQTKQYIRINKAFLGEGNALLFAKEKDSTQFVNSLDVRLIRLIDRDTVILKPDNSIPKEEGVFYSGDQTNAIYSFDFTVKHALNPNSKYSLLVTNTSTGVTATATTSLVNNFEITNPSGGSASYLFTPKNELSRFFVDWSSHRSARMYQLIIRLIYDDYVTVNGVKDTLTKSLDWAFPSRTTSGGDNEKLTADFSAVEYLQFIGGNLKTYPELNYRRAASMHIVIVAGGEELSTYIEVNKPSTSIVQDKPIYTNIQNGYGVFSGRYYKPPYVLTIGKTKDFDSLTCGRYTKKLKFLNADGTFPPCF